MEWEERVEQVKQQVFLTAVRDFYRHFSLLLILARKKHYRSSMTRPSKTKALEVPGEGSGLMKSLVKRFGGPHSAPTPGGLRFPIPALVPA